MNNKQTLISKWITGVSTYSLFSWLFDYPVYTFIIWIFGPICGGLIMIALSFLVDFYAIRFYDWSKNDWLALEYFKSLRDYNGANKYKKFTGYLLSKTSLWVQIVILSLKFNPFIVTLLLRDGAHQYNGLSRRDWRIFWGSFLITQAYWIAVIATGIELAEIGIEFIK